MNHRNSVTTAKNYEMNRLRNGSLRNKPVTKFKITKKIVTRQTSYQKYRLPIVSLPKGPVTKKSVTKCRTPGIKMLI